MDAFRLGATVRIAAGTYHGAVRPEYGTVTGEGAQSDTYRVIYGGWHMTYHADELTDVTGQGHGAQAAGYAVPPSAIAAERHSQAAECEFWEAHYAFAAAEAESA